MIASGLTTWGRLAIAVGLAAALSGCLADARDAEDVDADESELLAGDAIEAGEAQGNAIPHPADLMGGTDLQFSTSDTSPDNGDEVSGDPRPDPWDVGKVPPKSSGGKPDPGGDVSGDPRPDPWDIGAHGAAEGDGHSDQMNDY